MAKGSSAPALACCRLLGHGGSHSLGLRARVDPFHRAPVAGRFALHQWGRPLDFLRPTVTTHAREQRTPKALPTSPTLPWIQEAMLVAHVVFLVAERDGCLVLLARFELFVSLRDAGGSSVKVYRVEWDGTDPLAEYAKASSMPGIRQRSGRS